MKVRRADVLAIVFVVALVVAFVVAAPKRRSRNYGQSECVPNLRRLYVLYKIVTVDGPETLHSLGESYRGTNSSQIASEYFTLLSSALGGPWRRGHHLVCPLDRNVSPGPQGGLASSNLSYFASIARPSGGSDWVLMGNRNLDWDPSKPGLPEASWNPANGLHGTNGFILTIDGSVRGFTGSGVTELVKGSNKGNHLVFP